VTVRISQRGKEYLKTALTDRAISDRLKALAEDFQLRAEKASHVDGAKALARSAANAEDDKLCRQ
jgi:hypothetical protein